MSIKRLGFDKKFDIKGKGNMNTLKVEIILANFVETNWCYYFVKVLLMILPLFFAGW